MILFSDRGTPASYRHMNGYSSHTLRFIGKAGAASLVKLHYKTETGIRCLSGALVPRVGLGRSHLSWVKDDPGHSPDAITVFPSGETSFMVVWQWVEPHAAGHDCLSVFIPHQPSESACVPSVYFARPSTSAAHFYLAILVAGAEADALRGTDADHATRDLYEHIAKGGEAAWRLFIQVRPESIRAFLFFFLSHYSMNVDHFNAVHHLDPWPWSTFLHSRPLNAGHARGRRVQVPLQPL